MRFVPIKSEEQQGVLMLHRARELLVRQRTMLINVLRAHLAELGIATRLGPMGVKDAVALIEGIDQHLIPEIVRRALSPLCDQLRHVHTKIEEMDRQILEWHRSSALSQRLATIPGIGPVTASAIAASITDLKLSFRAAIGGVDWSRPPAEFFRRQGASWQDHEAGRSLYSPLAGDWGNFSVALQPQVESCLDTMGDGIAGAKAS